MAFEGKWKLDKSENFEEYMKEVGVSLITRKAAAHLKVLLEIKKEGDKYVCHQTSTLKDTTLEFKLGEEFEEITGDGRKFMSKIEMVDGKLVHTQKPIKSEDKPSVIKRWIEDDRLIMTLEAGNIVCRREYIRE